MAQYITFPGSLLKRRKTSSGQLVPQRLTVWATTVETGPVTTQTI